MPHKNQPLQRPTGSQSLTKAANAEEKFPQSSSLQNFFERHVPPKKKERTSTPSLRDDLDAFDTKVTTDSLFFTDVQTGLEIWWLKSHVMKRLSTFFVMFIFLIGALNLLAAIYLLSHSLTNTVIEDPYLCRTDSCVEISDWFKASIDLDVDPCDDFYNYVCGKYNNTDEHPEDTPEFIDLSLSRIHSEDLSVFDLLFKPIGVKVLDQSLVFYKACLDEDSREKDGINQLMDIINNTFPYFGYLTDPNANYHVHQMAQTMLYVIGDLGFFEVELTQSPQAKIHPPQAWTRYMSEVNVKPALTPIFEIFKVDEEAQKHIYQGLQVFSELLEKVWSHEYSPSICSSSLTEQNLPPSNQLKIASLALENELIRFSVDSDRRILDHFLRNWNPCVAKNIPAKYVKVTYASFWVLRLLKHLIRELDDISFARLVPSSDNMLFHDELLLRKKSLESQCVESMIQNLGYIPAFRLQKSAELLRATDDSIDSYHGLIINWAKYIAVKVIPNIPQFQPYEKVKIRKLLDEEEESVYGDWGRLRPATLIPKSTDIGTIEDVKLGTNHLENAFRGKVYTIFKAFLSWKNGDPSNIFTWNSKTFTFSKGVVQVRQRLQRSDEEDLWDPTVGSRLYLPLYTLGRPYALNELLYGFDLF